MATVVITMGHIGNSRWASDSVWNVHRRLPILDKLWFADRHVNDGRNDRRTAGLVQQKHLHVMHANVNSKQPSTVRQHAEASSENENWPQRMEPKAGFCLLPAPRWRRLNSQFHETWWLGLPIGRSDQLLAVIRSRIRIPDHFPHHHC